VADTGNNRVVLCTATNTDADEIMAVWNTMKSLVANHDIAGAVKCFSSQTADDYQEDYLTVGAANFNSTLNQVGSLTLVSLESGLAQYYFEQTIGGQTVTFPVEFIKENGVWKIFEF
jgi:hypothetical protein